MTSTKGTYVFRRIESFDAHVGTKIVAKLECGHHSLAEYGSRKARCYDCKAKNKPSDSPKGGK